MKKQLLSIIAALMVGTTVAQTPSPSWTISQNAAFTSTAVGIKFLDAVDPNVVWVFGYDGFAPRRNYNWVSHTINGGTTFTAGNIFPDTNTYVVANMEGIDANTAWVSSFMKSSQSQGAVHKTTNGGATWVNMTGTGMFTNTAAFTNIVSFFTPSVGITMGDPVNGAYEIWRTTNGGLSWSLVPPTNIPAPTSGEFGIVNLYAKQGTSNLWFGTQQGRIFYTNNAGVSWSVAACGPSSGTVTEIAFSTASQGLAYVVNSGQQFELYNTTNGGASWTLVSPTPANIGLNDVCGVPGTNQFVSVGAGTGNQIISYSNNNGTTWTDYGSTGIQYLTVDFADNVSGWSGSFSDQTNPSVGGIWKYNGAAIAGNVAPTSAFSMPANICLTGPSVSVAVSNSSTGFPVPTFSWSCVPSGGTFSSPTASNPVITFTAPNTYTIILTATNAGGTNSSSQVITVLACNLPVVNFSAPTTSVCNNISFNTTNTSTGGAPAPSYSWSAIPSTGVTFSPSPIAFNPTVKCATPGTYTLVLVATNSQGTVQATQTVNIVSCAPSVSFSIPPVFYKCTPSDRLQTQNGTPNVNGPLSYTWSIQPSSGVSVAPPGVNGTNIQIAFSNTAITNYSITLKASNPSGTAQIVQPVVVDFFCLGVEENNNVLAGVNVFPNPAHDQVNLSIPAGVENFKIKVVNVLGAVVLEEKVSNNTKDVISLNMSNKPKGVYFMSLEANNEKITRKIVIE